jgi:hypothetical protein
MGDIIIRDRITNKPVIVDSSEKHLRLSETSPETGEQKYKTASGRSLGFYKDELGRTRYKWYTDEEVWLRRKQGLDTNILVVDDDPRAAQAISGEASAGRQKLAQKEAGMAAAQGFLGTATLGATSALEGSPEYRRELYTEHPFLSGAAKVAGALTSAFVLPPLFLGRLAAPGAAKNLFGFAGEMGARTTASLTAVGTTPSLGDRIAGGAVRSAITDTALSTNFIAADLADENIPFTAQAIASAAGSQLLLGFGTELGVRGLAALGTLKGARIAGGAIGNLTKGFGASAVGQGVRGAAVTALRKMGVPNVIAWPVAKQMTKTPAARMVSGPRLRDAARITKETIKDADSFFVSKLAKNTPEELDDLFTRVSARGVGIPDDVAKLASPEIKEAIPKIIKGTDEYSLALTKIGKLQETNQQFATAFLRKTEIPAGSYADAHPGVKESSIGVLSEIKEELEKLFVDARSIKKVTTASNLIEPKRSIQAIGKVLNDLRFDVLDHARRDAAMAPVAELIERKLGTFLSDPKHWAAAAEKHASVRNAYGKILEAQQGLYNAYYHKGIDSVTIKNALAKDLDEVVTASESPTAKTLPSIERLKEGITELRMAEAIDEATHTKLLTPIEEARLTSKNLVETIEDLSSINRLRMAQKAGAPLANSFAVAGQEAAAEGSRVAQNIVSMVQTNAGFISRVSDGLANIEKALTGQAVTVPAKLALFAYRSIESADAKRAIYDDIAENIRELAYNPELMIQRLATSTEDINETDPPLAEALNDVAIRTVSYLSTKIPPPQQGITGNTSFEVSMAEIDTLLDIYGALQSPESLLHAVAEGTVTEDITDAVRTVYPDLYIHLILDLAAKIAEDATSVPYRLKVSMSYLLGEGVDPSLSADSVMALQSKAAQTQEQDKAIFGNRQLGFSSRATPGLSRVEGL